MLWQVLLCSLCTLWFFRRWRWLRLTSNIPTLPGTLPIIGVAHQTLGSPERFWKNLQTWDKEINALGGIAKVWMGPLLIIGVADADLGLSIMNSYLQKHHFYSFAVPVLGEGLFTSNGTTWKRHRKLLSPAFTQHVIDEFIPIFNKQSELLVEALKEKAGKGKFDSSQLISEITLESICETTLGLTLGSNNTLSQNYYKAIDKVTNVLIKRVQTIWLHPNFIYNQTLNKKEEKEAIDVVKKMSAKVIAIHKATNNIGNSYKFRNNTKTSRYTTSFLKLLMKLNDKGDLSDTEIREEIDTIIVAGYDTTSTTLQNLLVILGSYPEVQDRLYDEIKTGLPESSMDISKVEISKLLYLDAVIKEIQRLYPIVPLIARTADKTLKFDDFTIPDGTGIYLSIYGINRNEKYWGSDATEFKPERWLHASSLPNHPAAFASFSLGRRNCVGKAYAMLSLKTSVAHILRQYRVTADHTKIVLKYEFLLKPASGHFISIEQR